ncbi:glycosyltransferase, group 2 family protein [Bifidobacterium lemurum]|uniref:Glycosyltransferase, group 2 family protein n=1 Tax=Bifidobacterium lemurum TaxID=1603886 RepID=A0A261FW46_9BIFI|nr:glycosyltransferase family A protein [Bifidobacterium lemurum]OZG63195.1 glycosyltransferase, group 2 family protein [Bifidobacterium lemurum]QOL33517.1 glycosyltransferase family 2 protein [Bifidobacterium lemurum]
MSSANGSVDVVITSFNQVDFIREAVESAAQQSLHPDTIVIVDDGSSDPASLDVLAQLEQSTVFPGIALKVIRQANAGPSAARNTGIRATHGDYVCVLDGDDRLLPTFLERTAAMLDADPMAMAASGWMATFGVMQSVVRPTGGRIERFLARNCCPATCLIRRSMWERCGGYDESMRSGFEDWDCSLSLLEAGGEGAHVAIVDEPLIEYRTAPASPNITSMNRRLELMRFIINKHRETYQAHMADAICGVEAISIERLNMWERAVQACPDLASSPSAEPHAAEFMAHPSYGDGGMAAAVRLRSAGV